MQMLLFHGKIYTGRAHLDTFEEKQLEKQGLWMDSWISSKDKVTQTDNLYILTVAGKHIHMSQQYFLLPASRIFSLYSDL